MPGLEQGAGRGQARQLLAGSPLSEPVSPPLLARMFLEPVRMQTHAPGSGWEAHEPPFSGGLPALSSTEQVFAGGTSTRVGGAASRSQLCPPRCRARVGPCVSDIQLEGCIRGERQSVPWTRARRRRRTGPSSGAAARSHCTTRSTRKVRARAGWGRARAPHLVCSAGGLREVGRTEQGSCGAGVGKGRRGDPHVHTCPDLPGPLTGSQEDSISSPKQTAGRQPRHCLDTPRFPARLRFASPGPPGLDVDADSGVATPAPAGPLSHTAAKTAQPHPTSHVARSPPEQCLLSPKL